MDEPHTLVVLAEEELVLIDLETQGWPAFALPYLNSLHCSPITCSQHVSNVPDNLWQKIADAGQAQNKNMSSRVRLGCSSLKFSEWRDYYHWYFFNGCHDSIAFVCIYILKHKSGFVFV